jgi:hypothetical protein
MTIDEMFVDEMSGQSFLPNKCFVTMGTGQLRGNNPCSQFNKPIYTRNLWITFYKLTNCDCNYRRFALDSCVFKPR